MSSRWKPRERANSTRASRASVTTLYVGMNHSATARAPVATTGTYSGMEKENRTAADRTGPAIRPIKAYMIFSP